MRIENSFIPVRGVGAATERRLWEGGLTDWDAFDPAAAADVSGVGETTAERIDSFIADAVDRLADGDARYFDRALPSDQRWRLYENFRADACFFDIETTGLDAGRHDVTTVSVHRDGETTTLVRGDDLNAAALREAFADASLLVTFNGKRFDVPFLEESFDLSVDAPHIDLLYPCRRLDLTGGLKAVERAVGIERDRPDISGRDAVGLWRRYERGDADALETLVSYNRDDAVNLRALMDRVADSLHAETFVAPA